MPQIKEKAAFSNHLDEYLKAKVTTTFQLAPRSRDEAKKPSSPSTSTPSASLKLFESIPSPDVPLSQSPVTGNSSKKVLKREEFSTAGDTKSNKTQVVDLSAEQIKALFQQCQISISTDVLEEKLIDGKLLDLLEGHQDVLDLQIGAPIIRAKQLYLKLNEFKTQGGIPNEFLSPKKMLDNIGEKETRTKKPEATIKNFLPFARIKDDTDDSNATGNIDSSNAVTNVSEENLKKPSTPSPSHRIKSFVPFASVDDADDYDVADDSEARSNATNSSGGRPKMASMPLSSSTPYVSPSSAAPMMTKSAQRKRASFHAHEKAQADYLKSLEKKADMDSRHIVKSTKSAKLKRQSFIQKSHAASSFSGKAPSRRVSSYGNKDLAFFAPTEKGKNHSPMTFKVDENILHSYPDPIQNSFPKFFESRRSRSVDRVKGHGDDCEDAQNQLPFSRFNQRITELKSPRARSLSAPPLRNPSILEKNAAHKQSFISWNIVKVKEHGYSTNFAGYDNQISKPTCYVKYMSPTNSSPKKRVPYISPWSPDATKKLVERRLSIKPQEYINPEEEEMMKCSFKPTMETKSKAMSKHRPIKEEAAQGNRVDPRSPRERVLARNNESKRSGWSEENEHELLSRNFVEYNIQRVKLLKPRPTSSEKRDKTMYIVNGMIKELKDNKLVEYEKKTSPNARPMRISYRSPISPEIENLNVNSKKEMRQKSNVNTTSHTIEQMQKNYEESVEEAITSVPMEMFENSKEHTKKRSSSTEKLDIPM